MNKPKPAPIIKATYKAKSFTGSQVDLTVKDLDVRISQMVLWMMQNQTPALHVFDEYVKVREWWTAEGSAKNVGIEP